MEEIALPERPNDAFSELWCNFLYTEEGCPHDAGHNPWFRAAAAVLLGPFCDMS